MTAIPEGPTWAVATVLVGGLLLAVVREFLKRRPNGTSKLGERLGAIEAVFKTYGDVAGRLGAIEATLSGLNGDDLTAIQRQLGSLMAKSEENSREILRIRDYNHNELRPFVGRLEGRLANLELDVQELQRRKP